MKHLRGTVNNLLVQQSGQIQLLIIAPLLTLFFLSIIVRTASSAVDPSLEKKKVTLQLKRRLNQVRNESEEEPVSTPILTAPPPPQQTAKPAPAVKPSVPQIPLKTTVQVKKRATLEKILQGEGVGPEETRTWLAVARKYKEFKSLRLGQAVTLAFTGNDLDQNLETLSYEPDKRTLLVLEKKKDGTIAFRREMLPITLVWRAIGGQIEKSLYKTAHKAGVPKQVLDDFADMDWDLDFSDLQHGDSFKVIFEEFLRDGKVIELGQIVAAEIATKGKIYTLFPIPQGRGQKRGSPSSRAFLRYPLQFTRISSVFTNARFHPILERIRPHKGVDFAAPRGTPVRAVAGGKISFAGRQSGYGKVVSIDHPGPYDTLYAHLDRIVQELKPGDAVERGQVIGYVGSTGWATGPHLHFELHKDGDYINPLTVKLPMIELDGTPAPDSPAFAEAKKRATQQLSAVKIGDQSVSLVLAAPQNASSMNSGFAKASKPEHFALAVSRTASPAVPNSGLQEANTAPSRGRKASVSTVQRSSDRR